jgi:hypothetical protein
VRSAQKSSCMHQTARPYSAMMVGTSTSTQGVRGKYAKRMEENTNLVLIEPDLLDTFPDSASVNEALRSLKKIATRAAKPPRTNSPADPNPAPQRLTNPPRRDP